MTREKLVEIMAYRHKVIRERILRNIAFSPAHASLTCPQREKLADSLADDALSFDQPGYTAWVDPTKALAPDTPEEEIAEDLE